MDEKIPFNKQLRNVTREIHSISDALINAKLAFALSNDDVWGEGLLVFYEVFRFLEEAIENHKDKLLGAFRIEGINRTKAFEQDLDYYLPNNWRRSYQIRGCVAEYLHHMKSIEKENPDILIAYVYHLYMGLLSGGQIFLKKRLLSRKFKPFSESEKEPVMEGYAVMDFGDLTISGLKSQIIEIVNSIAEKLDDVTRQKILDESQVVFKLNNTLVKSVKGTHRALIKKCLWGAGLFVFLLVGIQNLKSYFL